MNPVPSERGTSFSGFLIFICSAWKFPSIMKPRMKRILLEKYISSSEFLSSLDIPVFIVSPIFWEVDARLRTQSAEYSRRSRLLILILAIPKGKTLFGNEHSPLSADPQ
jgi:hypothetical protein